MANCQENCDNNCAALDGLYEKAVNLIAYSNLINSWVNGPATGTVNVAGTNVPTLLNLATSLKSRSDQVISNTQSRADTLITNLTNRINNIPNSIIQLGGGISVDSNGQLYINFEMMPTDKFEYLLKSLRLPIWLSISKTFYVNGTSGSDTLDDKRGESASKPFKSIGKCAEYLANNYNVGTHTAYISITPGTYNERLTLPNFSHNGGTIVLMPTEGEVIIASDDAEGSVINTTGGNWSLRNLTIENRINLSKFNQTGSFNQYVVQADGGNLSLYNSILTIAASGTPVGNVELGMLYANGGSTSCAMMQKIYLKTRNRPSADNLSIVGIRSNGGAQITAAGANTASTPIGVEANAQLDISVYCSGGKISFNTTRTYKPQFTNTITANCKRYVCANGGQINTGTGDASFFPGTIVGTVESGTYSWYK